MKLLNKLNNSSTFQRLKAQFNKPNEDKNISVENALTPFAFDLSKFRLGEPQQSGTLSIIPIFGPEAEGKFTGPLTGLKLSKVAGYGNVELSNPSAEGIAIVPLHIGYIQDGAQNHAMCRSAFLAAGQKLMFEDACCVQKSQGGYLKGQEQWFFILPLELRRKALELRGKKGYSKLWPDISTLCKKYDLPARGHLDELIVKRRTALTRYQSRLELLKGQTGALFVINNQLVGIEIAPNANYFAELWMPLVCFCYGTAAAYQEEKLAAKSGKSQAFEPFKATTLAELRAELIAERTQKHEQLLQAIANTPKEKFKVSETEKFLGLCLKTAIGKNFSGQFVEDKEQLIYASICANKVGY